MMNNTEFYETETPVTEAPEEQSELEQRCTQESEVASDEEAMSEKTEPEKSGESEPPALHAEIEQLKKELEALSRELIGQKAFYERINSEIGEFCELYGDVSLKTMPDNVWDAVRNGVPLAAAYALAERRREISDRRAMLVNAENALATSGNLGGGKDDGCFSVAEVRAMSAEEIRRNYEKIVKSAKHW